LVILSSQILGLGSEKIDGRAARNRRGELSFMLMQVLPVRVNNDMDNYEWLVGFVFGAVSGFWGSCKNKSCSGTSREIFV